MADLEGGTDTDAIQKDVANEGHGTQRPHDVAMVVIAAVVRLVRLVGGEGLLYKVQQEEAQDDCNRHRRNTERYRGISAEDLGEEVEADEAK
ncbi:unannotated protein [freshwater metagenome]|uniref:Unannotated protein n=1 Tax=freshwater metagenome TaxID=449393 RepID=A0A6J6W3M3_9ZZZZ